MNFKWNINTGYVTNIPDRTSEVWLEDLEGMSDFDIEEYLYKDALEEFCNHCGVTVTNVDEVIAAVRALEKSVEEE